MIRDNEAQLESGVPFNLGPVRPGPGKPIKMWATGVGGSVVITTGDTDAAADALITVDATNDVEFELPSNTLQYINATFASGELGVIMAGAQTNT